MNSENKITYRQVGDYMIPNLTLSTEERTVELGIWGMKHKDYLMKNKRVLFNIMLTKGMLFQYLAEVNKQAEKMFFRLVDDMAKSEGITEQIKEENQMLWVCNINNIHARAREIVNIKLIYV